MMHRVTKQRYMELAKRLTSTTARFARSRLTPLRVDVAGSRLARDLGPADYHNQYLVEQTFRDAAAALREVGCNGDVQPFPIIERAAKELAKLKYRQRPHDVQIVKRCLDEMHPVDREIFRLFQCGQKHQEIAEQLHTDVETVRRSLVSTYTHMRIEMIAGNQPDREAAAR